MMNEEVRSNLIEAKAIVENSPEGIDLDPIHSFLADAQQKIAQYSYI